MLRFSANLSFLFTELQFLDRFKAAADAGFQGVEFLFPYDVPAKDIAARIRDNGLEVALINIWPGDFDAGERGLAGVKGREAEFSQRVDEALDYARVVDCRRLHAMAGLVDHGAEEETLVANLKVAARASARDGVTILTEPINRKDMPGYLVHRTAQAREIISSTGADNVGLQFDCYHRQIEEADTCAAISQYADLTRHYQIASPPDRGEPDRGDLDYREIFDAIEVTGYQGWIGCEYRPRGTTWDGLSWRAALGVG